jgi:hypothetical protein
MVLVRLVPETDIEFALLWIGPAATLSHALFGPMLAKAAEEAPKQAAFLFVLFVQNAKGMTFDPAGR